MRLFLLVIQLQKLDYSEVPKVEIMVQNISGGNAAGMLKKYTWTREPVCTVIGHPDTSLAVVRKDGNVYTETVWKNDPEINKRLFGQLYPDAVSIDYKSKSYLQARPTADYNRPQPVLRMNTIKRTGQDGTKTSRIQVGVYTWLFS